MIKFFRGYVAVDAEDVPRVFTLDEGAFARKGDLLEWQGEMFQVTDELFLDTETAEFRLIMDLVQVRQAVAVFSKTWSKDDA